MKRFRPVEFCDSRWQHLANSDPMDARLRCVLLLAAWICLTFASTGAELLYVRDRATAFAISEKEQRAVVLYTGRAVFCPNNDPRGYFFNFVVPHHPQLMTH